MKKSVWQKSLAILLLAASSLAAQTTPRHGNRSAQTETSIKAVLAAQSAAWNRGDIEGYMAGYWRSPKTVFVSGDSVTRGWQTVLERYKKHYDSRDKMGTLNFSDLEINSLTNDTALVIGRWHLQRAKD